MFIKKNLTTESVFATFTSGLNQVLEQQQLELDRVGLAMKNLKDRQDLASSEVETAKLAIKNITKMLTGK